MISTDILNKAAGLITKRGLARDKAFDSEGRYCLGAALVESAYLAGRFYEKEYNIAKVLLCGHLGITPSYDSMVDWNDDAYITKKGDRVFKHSSDDAIKALYAAINRTSV